MSEQSSKRDPDTPGPETDPSPGGTQTTATGEQPAGLWSLGALFHVCSRYPRRPDLPRVDRLAGILRQGLIAPATCPDGSVCSDLRLEVTGTDLPYNSLVFLHRFGPQSFLYVPFEPGRFVVFLDPALPVLTPQEMGSRWVILCQDEVYVRDQVPIEKILHIAVHPADADAVMEELGPDFQRAGIPLYDLEGNLRVG